MAESVFYLAPVVVLLTGRLPLLSSTPEFLWHFLPYFILTLWVFEEVGRGYGRTLFIEQFNMARFAAFAWSTLAWVVPRVTFKVTHKGAATSSALRFMAPQWAVMSLNLLAIPVGIGLYLQVRALPTAGLIANVIWAAIDGMLALRVLTFTAALQKRKREQYRFPVPLAGDLTFFGARVRGIVDNLSDRGLHFHGDLPPSVQPGSTFTGQLNLPDGPLTVLGQVRDLTPLGGQQEAVNGFGGLFTTSAAGQKRLERFLFGSNLQWIVNGYCDRAETPLSRLMPALVEGPELSPLSTTRWNAAELTSPGRPPVQVLASAPAPDTGYAWILSFVPLPQYGHLTLDSNGRMTLAPETAQLMCVDVHGDMEFRLFVYRVVGSHHAFVGTRDVGEDRRHVA